VDGERSARRWIGRRRAVSPDIAAIADDLAALAGSIDGDLVLQLETASAHECHRLTEAARPALETLLAAEPELKAIELDHERGGAVLSFGDGTRLRAAADRSVHPALERLARRLGGDPVYLSAAWLDGKGGVLLRLVCGAFWPMEVGPLVPAAA
jgi:hypothetical protein